MPMGVRPLIGVAVIAGAAVGYAASQRANENTSKVHRERGWW
jgi:hypothetical protein